ncbi:MAG TPA: ComEC/Rec2 family competence protein, partial [Bauldia sp.]|nr:ComEC/Rec2 family competence protein [Bauldia sp.]
MHEGERGPTSAAAPVRRVGEAARATAARIASVRRAAGFRLATAGRRLRLAATADRLVLPVSATLDRELDAGRGFLWLPVAFGAGIVVYFALPREPSAIALVGLAAILAASAWQVRRRAAAFRILVILAALAAGTTVMKLRTEALAAPVLPREMTAAVQGFVAGMEAARGGARLLLRVASIEGLPPAATPRTVRVTVRTREEGLAVGDALSLRARLSPPSGPVIPGGYDFGRAAFYDGIGAIGFAYGAPQPVDLGPAPLGIRLLAPVSDLRAGIRARVLAALPGDNGEIAAALIMGDQGGISERAQEAMRASGLGHVLSISGLHMALVAGSAFWLIRALLALAPGLALRRPIKKWAAAGALAVASFYLLISGGGVATERAYVMFAVMLLAVLLGRRAVTLRNVAIAALVVLVLEPESVLSASFQMSFAATVALVSGYEAISRLRDRRLDLAEHDAPGLSGRALAWMGGLFLTSLIAGLATTPFGAYHFQRLAPLSLLA